MQQNPPESAQSPVVLYTSFGQGPHVNELVFSASSAKFKSTPTDGYRLVIFTDNPKPFSWLAAEVIVIEPKMFDGWLDNRGYVYRLKIGALVEALRRFHAPVAMVDADTYFLKSPTRLFERISPGHTLMHIPEGHIGHLVALGHERHKLITHFVPTDDGGIQLHKDWVMWNSGVLGVHPADLPLVEQALRVNDSIWKTTGHKNSEQMAFTHVLSKNTRLGTSSDVVFHYFLPFLRGPFRARLDELLKRALALSEDQRAAFLYDHRPQPNVKKKLSAMCKRPFKQLGFFKSDLNTSV